jgi:hypothetical protein
VFFDLHRSEPGRLDVFAASIKDGRAQTLHRQLFVVETVPSGEMRVRQPTLFIDVLPAPLGTPAPDGSGLPDRVAVERCLLEQALEPFRAAVTAERERTVRTIREHVAISLNTLIDRQQQQLSGYLDRQIEGATVPGLDGLIGIAEGHLDQLNGRLETRLAELEMELHCTIADVTHLGRAWVLPHPERDNPGLKPMVRDEEIERVAVQEAIRYEEARGCVVEDVQQDDRGFDLISRKPHPADPKTALEVRFIEVKGRAGVGEVALTPNEYHTAERLKQDYWLYAVFNCGARPELHAVQDPVRLGWRPVMAVEHYHVGPQAILEAGQ